MNAEFAPGVVHFFARWSGPSAGCVDHMVAEADDGEGTVQTGKDFLGCEKSR